MMLFEETSAVLILIILALIAGGIGTLFWGKRLGRYQRLPVLLLVAGTLGGLGYALSVLAAHGYQPEVSTRGWLWPRDQAGALTVGLMADPFSLILSILSAALTGVVLLAQDFTRDERRSERIFAGGAFALAGTILALGALTPWLALAGVSLAALGGVAVLAAQTETEEGARAVFLYGAESAVAILLAALGLLILVGEKKALIFMSLNALPGNALSGSGLSEAWAPVAGAVLLVIGALGLFRGFPFLSWSTSDGVALSPSRATFAHLLPATAAFALLLRSEPHLRETELLPALGWFCLASTALTAASAIFQAKHRALLSGALATLSMLAAGVLCFAGGRVALPLWIGIVLGGSALMLAAGALDVGGSASNASRKKAVWAKIGAFLGVASATGLIGFVSAPAIPEWLSAAGGQPSQLAAFGGSAFIAFLTAWKATTSLARLRNHTQCGWFAALGPLILVVLALGLLWNGTLSGGVIPEQPDHFLFSLLDLMGRMGLSASVAVALRSEALMIAGAVLLLAIIIGLFTANRSEDFWMSANRKWPGLTSLLNRGYALDAGLYRLSHALSRAGAVQDLWFGQRTWGAGLPRLLERMLRALSRAYRALDESLLKLSGETVRRAIEIPAKLLQLLQNGDAQWYLLFGFATGIALLVHFI